MDYVNYCFEMEDYALCREMIIWLSDMLESMKIDKNAAAYVDKVITPCHSECANLSFLLEDDIIVFSSDVATPRSHFDTAAKVTFNASANCSCVMKCSFLSRLIFAERDSLICHLQLK